MRNAAKMMAVTAATRGSDRGGKSGRREPRNMEMGYWPYMGGDYDVYDRFRDRRGREHYDNGRYAPRNERDGGMMANYPWYNYPRSEGNEMRYNYPEQNRIGYERGNDGGNRGARSDMDEMESRRRYRRDSRGRFRSDMDDDEMEHEVGMHYPMPYPFPPPVYEQPESREQRREGGTKNPIGFAVNANKEIGGDYKSDAEYHHMNEMERRGDLRMLMGGASAGMRPFDREMAEEWMAGLENEDGTRGPHWSMDQIKQLMAQKGWKEDPIRAWVAMNIMYSDYCAAAKKVNANNIEFYVAMAKAFLGDKDAGAKDKLSAYYEYIVK